jgi:hypothetical protein
MNNNLKITTTIICPICKYRKELVMDADISRLFYFCEECGARLKPRPGDCCVYKSYGSTPCTAVQEGVPGGCSGLN